METRDPDPGLESAKRHFFAGLADLEAGRLEAAELAFVASLEEAPGRVPTLLNLATTRLRLNRPVDAIATVDRILASQPDVVDARLLRAMVLARLGLREQALAACDRALAIDPGRADIWSHRGGLLRELGRLDDATESYGEALRRGGDAALNGYFLAAVAGRAPPPAAPSGYVEGLFDEYASRFDAHLVDVLGYRGHLVLAEHLQGLARRWRSALDLGCGTGLCGPLLRPHADRLTGVDLSARMLDRARDRGVYDRLECAELVGWLQACDERFDLVVCADVLIYFGDLDPVFAAVRPVLEVDGVWAFSVELIEIPDDDAGFGLRPSLRYAHSERFVRELAARHGFVVAGCVEAALRKDKGEPVAGLCVYLMPGAAV